MSQFHFPRINFFGRSLIDPATANNGWYLPLVIFDPSTISVFIPPRVYLQDNYLPSGISREHIEKLLPQGAEIKLDDTTLFKGSYFVEITPIDTPQLLTDWARVPLGEYELDQDYIPLYQNVIAPVNRGPLLGSIPGYWNYYGSMRYKYINVKVASIATGIVDGEEEIINEHFAGAPQDLRELIGAKLNMNLELDDDTTNAAVMIDLLPTMAMYSQIFCDKLTLYHKDKIFFSGNPLKASLRMVNAFRVVNENMPFGGSGVFISAIPIDELDEGEATPLLRIFEKYGDRDKKLKGIFIYQVVSEVEENRNIDYRRDGNIPNPAFSTLSGRICPWYEGDMCSWTIARQLIGDQPFLLGRNSAFDAPVCMMSPTLFDIDREKGVLRIDMLNNFPLQINQHGPGPFEPNPAEHNTYSLYPLGEVELYFEKINPIHEIEDKVLLGSILIDNDFKSRDDLYEEGAMYLLSLPDQVLQHWAKYRDWNLSAYSTVHGKKVRIMTETPIVLVSDQAGLYCDEGDDPAKGFRSYRGKKEPCYLRIFERGNPVQEPMDVTFIEYRMSSSGALRTDSIYRVDKYKDGDLISLDTGESINAIYSLIPFRTNTLPKHGYPAAVVQTGFFINLKVLPSHHLGAWLDPLDPEYPKETDFDAVYNQIFIRYALLTPTMNFHKERFESPAMAKELLRRMSLENWEHSWYMPASRDVSSDQLALLKKWAQQFIGLQRTQLEKKISPSDESHHKHLGANEFFNK